MDHCSHAECRNPIRSKGLCVTHYNQRLRAIKPPPQCSVDGCEHPVQARGWCNTHYATWYRHGDVRKGAAAPRRYVPRDAKSRHCTRCGEEKDRENFPISPRTGRMHKWCFACIEKYNEIHQRQQNVDAAYARRLDKVREYRMGKALEQHGLTMEGYLAMVEKQGDRCAICRTETCDPSGRMTRWCIDHDHVTGAVRGLLCRACNLGLGSFSDDVAKMRAAIEYISEHNTSSTGQVQDLVR